MPGELLGFQHEFVRGGDDAPTLLLLHGTGGDERDLLPLGERLLPGANLLSPRGRVLEHGMPRFFRRLAEGVFDVPDLHARTHELADFVAAAAREHGFDPARVLALGYSNGANIASSLLLLRPEAIGGGVLLRGMLPFEAEKMPDLGAKRVLLLAGQRDPYSRTTEALAELLRRGGARVDVQWSNAGHELAAEDLQAARAWLATATAPGD